MAWAYAMNSIKGSIDISPRQTKIMTREHNGYGRIHYFQLMDTFEAGLSVQRRSENGQSRLQGLELINRPLGGGCAAEFKAQLVHLLFQISQDGRIGIDYQNVEILIHFSKTSFQLSAISNQKVSLTAHSSPEPVEGDSFETQRTQSLKNNSKIRP